MGRFLLAHPMIAVALIATQLPSDNPNYPPPSDSGSEESNGEESGEETPEGEEADEENTRDTNAEDANGGGGPPTHPGGDPTDPRSSDAWLDHYCSGRSNVPKSLDDLDQRAVDTNCEDAVVNPNPAATGGETNDVTTFINCSPEVEGRAQGEEARSLLHLLARHGEEQNCTPNALPGPDGQCSGLGRKYGIGQGTTIWMGLGDLIGIEPCAPKVCQ